MSVDNLRTIYQRLHLIERAIVSTRVEIESMLAGDLKPRLSQRSIDVSNGLRKLFSRSDEITEENIAPYMEFSEGVCCAIDRQYANFISIKTSVVEMFDHDGAAILGSCLHVSPVFDGVDAAQWATLEVDLDADEIRKASNIAIRFMPIFRFETQFKKPNLTMWVRLFKSENEYIDLNVKSFPAVSSPIMFTYSDDFSKIDSEILSNMVKARVMIGLPISTSGQYEMIVSYFNTQVVI
ncbi:hypothetical protein [Methylobacterium currus]|uniref:hypothetical protein n=1 Tax=Methylobacterium currus TaxID=2051553 RepID=UPI000F4DFDFF|nr:hypothetical protein [Methylobacterium currus]